MSKGVIKKVAGPLVIASGMRDANMFDVVRVSKQRLIGEIIEMHGDEASIQVYEETSGLGLIDSISCICNRQNNFFPLSFCLCTDNPSGILL